MVSYFFVIDGIDGSGKSAMLQRLHNYLFSRDKRFRVLTTREPTSGTYGRKIREMLKLDRSPQENAAELTELFIRDRQEHLQTVILPYLQAAKGEDVNIVVCDRYYHSTIAFQSAQGVSMQELIKKNKPFLKPTITFILDLDPEIALGRIHSRKKEKFEERGFMKELRERFRKLPEMLDEKIIMVDASREKGAVFKKIKDAVDLIL